MTTTLTAPVPAAPSAATAGTLLERADARATVERWIAEWQAQNPEEAEAGILPDDLAELLELADVDLQEKAGRLGAAYHRAKAELDALDVEIKRLQARKKSREAGQERRKRYADLCLQVAGVAKLEHPLATVAYQLNNPSVDGEAPAAVIEQLWRGGDETARFVSFKPAEYALNKTAVLAAAKAKEPLPEILAPHVAVVRTTSVRIR